MLLITIACELRYIEVNDFLPVIDNYKEAIDMY